MYKALHELQTHVMTSRTEESQRNLVLALKALSDQANNNQQDLKQKREEDKEKHDAVVKKNWPAGWDDCR